MGLLASLTLPVHAQSRTASPAEKEVAALITKADSLQRVNLEECHAVLLQALDLTRNTSNDSLHCKVLTRLGYSSQSNGNLDSAIHYLSLFFNKCGKRWPEMYVGAKTRMAHAYNALSDQDLALESIHDAQAELHRVKSPETRAVVHMNFARVYQPMHDLEKQKYHTLEALRIIEQENIERQKPKIYSYTGVLYNLQSKYDSAIFYLKKSIEASKLLDDQRQISVVTANIGEVFYSRGIYDSASHYLHRAEALAAVLDDYDFNMYLGHAIPRADASMGDYKAAYERILQTLDQMQESMDEKHVSAINEMRVKFNTELKEQQIAQQELEIQTSRNRYVFASILLVLVLAILIIIFIFYRKLQRTNKALDEANATKDKFFAIIAHDLRGAATSFQGVGEMLKAYLKSGKIERIETLSGMLDESASRLNRLLDNLLQWALSQLNTIPYHPENIKLRALINEVIDQVESQSSAKSITLKNNLTEDMDAYADADGVKLMTRNLLTNAIKFTDAGGEILIQAQKRSGGVELEIRDNGIGMSDVQVANLFEMKETKRTSGTAGERGSGIGLLLVKEFVELNKGSISVESKPGQGTAFRIVLPLVA